MTGFTAPRELARRVHDGIEVTLLWDPLADTVSIAVVDGRNDYSFVLPVPNDAALDAFDHPYAYAPEWIGVRAETGRETSIAEG
jgi:hypothetical protein